MNKTQLRFAIIRYMVDQLQDVGKTKTQKMVYFLQNVFGVPLNYVFKMYYYGTYAEELDDELSDMRLHGYLRIEPDPDGYGYHIQPGEESIPSMDRIVQPFEQKVANCLNIFGDLDATKLELYSALHFVTHRLNFDQKSDVVARVAILKPKFDKCEIENAYDELQELVKQ